MYPIYDDWVVCKTNRYISINSNKSKTGGIDLKKALDCIFKPKSIGIIGTSRKKGTLGREILHNLLTYGFNGPIYPINPHAEYVHSMKCYPSILDVPYPIDLAIIVVPKTIVPKALKECGEKGVKGVVVITAGYKEVGEKGIKLEKELLEIIRTYDMRMIGPNCMGIINTEPDIQMNATFASEDPLEGHIGFLSQSGALGVVILEYAKELNIGFSKFVSMGNKADISGNDLLEDLECDDNSKIILLYIESFGNPRKFTTIARRISKKKPIIAVKSGRTFAGAKAASSHTGALVGMDLATDALFDQCGVLRANTIEELFDYAQAFINQPLPKGNRVAILTNAGGPGILATDACVGLGLNIAEFEPGTIKTLRKKLPEDSSVTNPIDLLAEANAEMYQLSLEAILKDKNVDAVISIFVPPLSIDPMDIALKISSISSKYDKPIVGCFMIREDLMAKIHDIRKLTIPIYIYPESAAKALAAMYFFWKKQEQKIGKVKSFKVNKAKVRRIINDALCESRCQLTKTEVKDILTSYGFTLPKSHLVDTADKAVKIAKQFGYPVVLKIDSPDILHKTDVGGILMDVRTEQELRKGFQSLLKQVKRHRPKAKITGIQIQKMIKGGKELILGMTLDPNFGPLIMAGLGGIYVEVLKDISFRIVPVTDEDAKEMIEELKSYLLLKGVRGEQPVNLKLVVEHIQRLSQLVNDFLEIEEMDINPILFFPGRKAPLALDARITLCSPENNELLKK
jgi:acetyltransferase